MRSNLQLILLTSILAFSAYSLSLQPGKDTSNNSTVLIFNKDQPSKMILPNNETVLLGRARGRKSHVEETDQQKVQNPNENTTNKENAESEELLKGIEDKDKTKITQYKTEVNNEQDDSEESDEQETQESESSQSSSQQSGQISSMVGKYRVSVHDEGNQGHPKVVKINATHVSYKLCSYNECSYTFKKQNKAFQIHSCTLTPRKSCKPFSDLYYKDLQFLVHLELSDYVQRQGKNFKFFDQVDLLRLWLVKDE